MKTLSFLFIMLFAIGSSAQKGMQLPRGSVFGSKPDTTAMMNATRVEAYMGNRTRISTTLRGKVLKVTKQKGGWFDVDAGKGKIIAAHFKNYNVTIPVNLEGRIVIMEGIAQKQFIADDGQHFAGDTVYGKKQHNMKVNPKRKLTFEVKGLMVDKAP